MGKLVLLNIAGNVFVEIEPVPNTVKELKSSIASQTGISESRQHLVQGDSELDIGDDLDVGGLPITFVEMRVGPVILDIGSGLCKAGFAGDSAPLAVFPSVVGRPTIRDTEEAKKKHYVGDEAKREGCFILSHPVEHGIVTNWDDMEVLWHHTFYNELRVDPSEHPVLLTDVPLGPKCNREKLTSLVFETFKAPAMYVSLAQVLALFASGRTTGVVLDSGDGVTHVVPIYEGYVLPHAIIRCKYGGRKLTEYMTALLAERGYSFVTVAEQDLVENYKQTMCSIMLDTDVETPSPVEGSGEEEHQYVLPDGNAILPGYERFRCPEALFKPTLLGIEAVGIHQAIKACICKTDCDIRSDMTSNIVLVGGNTMFPGIQERVTKEMRLLATGPALLKVSAYPDRKHAAWLGGSILSGLGTFKESWISKEEFMESGPSIVNIKCNF